MAFGLAVLVGNVVATGIMRTPGEVARHLSTPTLILAAWIVGGVYALLGAMSLAEGGVIVRRSGGLYAIVLRAFGAYPGFVTGWTDWIATASTTALGATVLVEFSEPFFPALAGRTQLVAAAVVLGFGWLQWGGIKSGDLAQQFLSGLKALAFAALIGCALFMTVPVSTTAPVTPAVETIGVLAAVILALQAVILTYDGWVGPLYFGEETVDVERTMPRAMIGGILIVIAIYVLFNAGMLRVLGADRMVGDPFVAASASTALFGANGDLAIRLLAIIAILGGVNSNLLFNARVPMAMSRDGLLPAALSRVNAGGTPVASHALSVLVALAFVVSGTFNTILALAAFFFVANYLIAFASIIALRVREPDTPRPFRVPGYPVTTGLVLLGSVAFLIGAVMADRVNSIAAALMIAASYPVYRMARRST